MSFSSGVKEELYRHISPARHCQLAELAALLHFNGSIGVGTTGTFLQIHAENALVVRKCFTLLQKTFNISTETRVQQENQQTGYFCRIDDPELILRILQGIKFLDQTGSPTSGEESLQDGLRCPVSRLLIRNSCCQRAFLRGAFLAAGSMSNPGKGYHLEIVCSTMERAEQIQSIMKEFELDARIVTRKKNQVVYLKEGSQIVDFLGVVEAGSALMNLENIRIRKEISNNINRKVNCETANIGKTVSAAVKQIEDIRYIETHVGFSQLTEELEETAVCRLRYPEATLKELGEMMNPPVGKSGVNHRLRKLGRIADELRGNKEDYND